MKQKPQPAQAFPPSPKRAAIYIRVSSKKQEDGYSLEFQQEKCLAFIEEQGHVIAVEKHIFVDVHTGAEYLERPGLKAMREAAHHREFDILVMYDLTRFARDRIHAAIVREDLRLHNIITQTLKQESDCDCFHQTVQVPASSTPTTREDRGHQTDVNGGARCAR